MRHRLFQSRESQSYYVVLCCSVSLNWRVFSLGDHLQPRKSTALPAPIPLPTAQAAGLTVLESDGPWECDTMRGFCVGRVKEVSKKEYLVIKIILKYLV